jgi:hypothetical protein
MQMLSIGACKARSKRHPTYTNGLAGVEGELVPQPIVRFSCRAERHPDHRIRRVNLEEGAREIAEQKDGLEQVEEKLNVPAVLVETLHGDDGGEIPLARSDARLILLRGAKPTLTLPHQPRRRVTSPGAKLGLASVPTRPGGEPIWKVHAILHSIA